MKPTTQTPKDCLFDALCRERDETIAAFARTSLAPFVATNNDAFMAWVRHDSPETCAALAADDEALERAALADPTAAQLYAKLTTLNLQIRNHCRAVGIN